MINKTIQLSVFALLSLILWGCGSTGNEALYPTKEKTNSTARKLAASEPHLIHVNYIERLATLRNGESLDGFLITTDLTGAQTGVLKTLPIRSSNRQRTADILEGRPEINNRIRPANEEEAASLSKIYRDATADNS